MGPRLVGVLVACLGLQRAFTLENVLVYSAFEILGIKWAYDQPVAQETHVEPLARLGGTGRLSRLAPEFSIETFDRPPPSRRGIGPRESARPVASPTDRALRRGTKLRVTERPKAARAAGFSG
jgi:hypothetical protein